MSPKNGIYLKLISIGMETVNVTDILQLLVSLLAYVCMCVFFAYFELNWQVHFFLPFPPAFSSLDSVRPVPQTHLLLAWTCKTIKNFFCVIAIRIHKILMQCVMQRTQ